MPTITHDFTKDDGTPFAKQASVKRELKKKQFDPDEFNVVSVDGGFVGRHKNLPRSKPEDTAERSKAEKAKPIKVRVHRSNVDPDNKDLPISVCVNSTSQRRRFAPGQVVELLPAQINVLKTSVEEVRLPLSPDSGIYDTANPMRAAQAYYPNMTPELDPATGEITMVRRTPNYLIEYVE